jgi:hypothetical protein
MVICVSMIDHTFSPDVAVDGVQPGNQFILATVSGIAMAVICALLWTTLAFFTGPQLDYLALGVGALVGLAVRFSGKGTTPAYGLVAMVLALISSLAGNTLGVIASGTHKYLDIFGVAQRVRMPEVFMSLLYQATATTYLIFTGGVVLAFLVAVRR